MLLITELNEEVKYLSEAKEDGKKNLYIEGIFLQSSVKNRNGRIYPEEIMDKEVGNYLQEKVEQKRALGELGHPNGPQINLDRVSHRITEMKKDGKNWIGKAIITETPMGNIARGLIESGTKLGVSSRGMGTLKTNKNGIIEVQSDFKLATAADIVADPSAPSAFVNGIMENCEWIFESNTWKIIDVAEQTKMEIENAVRKRELQEKKLKIFEDFINKISKI